MQIIFLLLSLVAGAASTTNPWNQALKPVGLNESDLKLDVLADSQFGGGPGQIPFLRPLREDPLRIPEYVRLLRTALLTAKETPTDQAQILLARVGIDVRRTLAGDPLAAQAKESILPNSLDLALRKLGATKKASSGKIPKEVSEVAAYLILSEISAVKWRDRALEKLDKKNLTKYFRALTEDSKGGDEDSVIAPVNHELSKIINHRFLMAGGIDLVHAVSRARDLLFKIKDPGKFSAEWQTPLGNVVINGTGENNKYENRYLLIIDLGGDDFYRAVASTKDTNQPVSVSIDVSGNDSYYSDSALLKQPVAKYVDRKKKGYTPALGAGVFGYGILADFAGNDSYRAVKDSMGFGQFGLGLLWDTDGNDSYDCYSQCQGAAFFGGGMLVDGGGDDKYETFQLAQGFGGPTGGGLLLDTGTGKDSYLANTTTIDFPALVDKKHNTSMAQGMGLGLRADFTDGQGLAGGFGMLVDGGGDNNFEADFFSQGSSYWYSVGILSVGNGNDTYKAGKYAQGAGVHYSSGILNDTGGNDNYSVQQELGIGQGHDFSTGFFIDEAGDDQYVAPALSLGCASANGVGLFWDQKGNDTYKAPEKLSLGCAAFRITPPSLREYTKTIGVFADTGGINKFETPLKGPGNDETWVNPSEGPPENQSKLIGVGISDP